MADFAKEFESFKKVCMDLEENSKRYKTRCLRLETEVDDLRKTNQELEVKIAAIQKFIDDDDDDIHEVVKKIKVLECEKRKAETEVLLWKEKVKELESKVDPTNEKDGCPNKKMASPTPGVAQSTFPTIIGISYEDVEHTDEEHMGRFIVHSSNTRSAKRKRAANIIASDGDDDDGYDDNAPISTLKTQHAFKGVTDSVQENVSRSRLTRLRKLESGNKKLKNNNVVDDESEREDESLGGFSSQSVSVYDSESGDSADESEDALNEYKETLDKIGRKSLKLKWELEADMLSDFGKDHILCMSAVCALYRQQTDDEKDSKVTIHYNERGFNQPDANRGSALAVFLMGRDPNGDLNKTVEELKEYDPEGVEECRSFAYKYSKQLFKIYQNKEDPYFPPSPYGAQA